ncbi:GNAT family N-acetyltransferase [Actinoplanes sp. RD1]|uniref:GNAT family N-acetyltransferase n=1 Tax=Actinoplanes sp. RD1 TaxID=3064538 RepID=UPI002740405E|nr:GNAT family N-acetyltransferase [Actinoplanes sp. RD1]
MLEPLADHHFEREVELDSDREVLRYLYARARTRDEVKAAHERRLAAADDAGLGYWAAFLTAAPGDFVGLMMLPAWHEQTAGAGEARRIVSREAELGYRLVRRHWRRGLATEAGRALLEQAFGAAGVSRVVAQTMAVNSGSRGVMEALGMRHVRTFFPQWEDPLPGSEAGEVEYELTRDMWDRRATR